MFARMGLAGWELAGITNQLYFFKWALEDDRPVCEGYADLRANEHLDGYNLPSAFGSPARCYHMHVCSSNWVINMATEEFEIHQIGGDGLFGKTSKGSEQGKVTRGS